MFLVVAPLLSVIITTSASGHGTLMCDTLFPCNFKAALERLKRSVTPSDTVVVVGERIERPEDLNDFRDLVEFSLMTNHIVIGQNVTVNGSLFRPTGPSFIVIQGAPKAQIRGFTFTEFNTTVVVIRQLEEGVFSDCNFVRNQAHGGLGIVAFGFGKLRVRRCNFLDNFVTNASVLQAFTTQLDMKHCVIERNVVADGPNYPIFLLSNSVVDITNSLLKNNTAPQGALMRFSWRSFANMFYVEIDGNHNREVMLSDGTVSISFIESEFRNNHGTLFRDTSSNGDFLIDSSLVSNNDAEGKPFIEMHGGTLKINRTCVFVGNSGSHFLKSDEVYQLRASNIHLHNNTFTKQIFKVKETSSVRLTDSSFINNSIGNSVINGSELSVFFNRVNCDGNFGSIIECQNCNVSLYSSSFVNSDTPAINISSPNGATTSIIGAQFMNRVDTQIFHHGNIRMLGVRFRSSKLTALNGTGSCWFCEYNQTSLGCYDIRATLVVYSLGLLLILFVCYSHAERFRLFSRRFCHKLEK